MITIRRNSLIGTVFWWAHLLWSQFRGVPYAYIDRPDRTDMCTLVRTVLVSAPLALVVNAVAIGAAIFAIGCLAIEVWLALWGVGLVLAVMLAFSTVVALCAGTMVGACMLTEVVATSETAATLKTFYRAKKARICPFIEISGGDHAST